MMKRMLCGAEQRRDDGMMGYRCTRPQPHAGQHVASWNAPRIPTTVAEAALLLGDTAMARWDQ